MCTYVCLWYGYTCFYDQKLQDNSSTCAEKIEIAVEHQRERQNQQKRHFYKRRHLSKQSTRKRQYKRTITRFKTAISKTTNLKKLLKRHRDIKTTIYSKPVKLL